MEYWKIDEKKKFLALKPIIPPFHFSIIP